MHQLSLVQWNKIKLDRCTFNPHKYYTHSNLFCALFAEVQRGTIIAAVYVLDNLCIHTHSHVVHTHTEQAHTTPRTHHEHTAHHGTHYVHGHGQIRGQRSTASQSGQGQRGIREKLT